MDEQQNHDIESFEAALRQLTPVRGNLSAEETFYQAGWNAAQRVRAASRRREISGFAVGIVCGLTCSIISLQIWMASDTPGDVRSREMSVVSDQRPDEPQETVMADSGGPGEGADGSAESRVGGLDEVFALMSPGQWFHVSEIPRQSPVAVGATERMMRGVRMDAFRNAAPVPFVASGSVTDAGSQREQPESRESLRAFPLPPDAVNEWL